MKRIQNRNSVFLKKSILLFCLLFFHLFVVSCSLFRGYEHRPHSFYQANILFEDNKQNLYFEVGTGTITFNTYSTDETRHYIKRLDYPIFYNDGYNYKFSASNSSYLFVYLVSHLGYLDEDGNYHSNLSPIIRMYTKEFEIYKTIVFEDDEVKDFICSDNYLYILLENKTTNANTLYRYDYYLDSKIVLVDNVIEGSSYKDDDIHLFFMPYFHSINNRCLGKYGDKTCLLQSKQHFFTDNIDLCCLNGDIQIVQNGIEQTVNTNLSFTDIYEKVYLIDQKLIFAAYRYERTSLCNIGYDCICGLKESYLFNYDLLTNHLSLIQTFSDGTFLIDYGLNDVEYYYDGCLYENNVFCRECEKVEPKKTKEGLYSGEEHYYLSYCNGKFYGI